MKENVKPNPPKGKPEVTEERTVFSPDGHGGIRVNYFENELLKVPVPEWVNPLGYEEMPSSAALPMLLRSIQQPNVFSREPDTAQRRRRRFRKTLKNLARIFKDPADRQELDDAVRTARAIHNYPTEKLRETALDQFASLYPNPIASQRWHEVEAELLERAEKNGRSVSAELVEAVKAAAAQVCPTSSPERSVEANLRQELNESVTRDFLGPDWRKTKAESLDRLEGPGPSVEQQPALEEALLRNIDDTNFLTELRSRLSPSERELMDVRRSGVDYRAWAKNEWGWMDSTVDNTMSRILKKGHELARRKNLL